MYNNNYNRPKVALKAQDIRRSKGKGCGYYLRIIFFFSSLIQSLIIVSLVLFLVYGQPEKSADEKRVEELEQSFKKLSSDKARLMKEKSDLTATLKTKTTEKDAADKKVVKLTAELESAKGNLTKQAMSGCNTRTPPRPIPCAPSGPSLDSLRNLQTLLDQQKSLYRILQSNFTQTVQALRYNLDTATKDKHTHEITTMRLKQEKNDLNSELTLLKNKCKEDFVSSLKGIKDVTSAFLGKIDNLFPDTFTFHLTCSKQQEQMQKIQANCTSLSRQVEDKFQSYLNSVGNKVSELQANSSRLEVENIRLTSESEKCTRGRAQEAAECTKMLQEAQQVQDRLVEPLLINQKQLLREKQILETTCLPKPPAPKPDSPVFGSQNRMGQLNLQGLYTAVQSKAGSSQPTKTT